MHGLLYLSYAPLAAAGVAAGLAAFVLIRGSRHLASLAFSAGLVLFGLQELCWFVALWAQHDAVMLWGIRLATATRLILPIPWLVFGLTFANGAAGRRIRTWWPALLGLGVSGVAGIVLLPSPAMVAVVARPGLPGDLIALGVLGKAAHAAALVGVVGVLFHLESLLRHSTGESRKRIKHLLIGLFAAFGAEIYAISRFLLFSSVEVEAVLIEAASLSISTGFIAVTMVRHRLFEVEVFVSRHVAYRSATLALVGGYLIALGLAGEAFRRFQIPMSNFFLGTGAFVALLGLGVAAFSERVRRRVKLYIDTHFYRHKHDYRQRWIEFTRSLGPAVRLEDVLPRLLGTLLQAMWVDRAAVFLSEAPGGDLVLIRAAGLEAEATREDRRIPARSPLHGRLAACGVVDVGAPGEEDASLRDLGLALLAPMEGTEGLVGALAVGPELSGHPFTTEDRELLATIAGQAAAAVLTARLSQDLAVAKGMEALHRLATFLLHDLKNCASTLTMVTVNARDHIGDPEFQRDTLQAIASTAAKMRRLIAKLSAWPADPDIEREPVDVSQVVKDAVADFRNGLDARVLLRTDLRSTPPVLGDPAHIGGVVTNLLVNAAEATGAAGALSVETFPDGAWICVRVGDTGPGIPEATVRNGLFQPFRSTKRGGLGIGLYQCKTIMDAHGGRIEVESREGQGTKFTLRFPARR